jgi:hypothetical protein
VVDALSRSMKVIRLAVMSTCEIDLKKRVISAHGVDEFFKTVKIHLGKEPTWLKYEGYQLISDGLLTYKGRLYICKVAREVVGGGGGGGGQRAHSDNSGGHSM